jgi:hypothetical protein
MDGLTGNGVVEVVIEFVAAYTRELDYYQTAGRLAPRSEQCVTAIAVAAPTHFPPKELPLG